MSQPHGQTWTNGCSRQWIYIIGGDQTLRTVLSLALRTAGHQCKSFAAPREVWDTLLDPNTKPALLIIDFDLPEEEAIAVLHACKKLVPTALVLSIGEVMAQSIIESHGLQIDLRLPKPFGYDAFILAVASLLPSATSPEARMPRRSAKAPFAVAA